MTINEYVVYCTKIDKVFPLGLNYFIIFPLTRYLLEFTCTSVKYIYSGTSLNVHLGLRTFRLTYGDLSKMLLRFTYKISVYVRSSEKFELQQVGESSEAV